MFEHTNQWIFDLDNTVYSYSTNLFSSIDIRMKKYISKSEFTYINDLLKTIDLKKNLFVFEVSSKKKIVLVSIKNNLKTSDAENLGAEFYKFVN